ncbi:MAG: hypothetical protein IAE83_09860 [Anaerolinea sp.]|nr:hypothetical protein [Anaerolinea sp.]
MDWIMYIILFALSLIFYIPIGAGSIEYHVWLYRPSIDNLQYFDDQLRFPFRMFRLEREAQRDFLAKVDPGKAMIARLIGTVIPMYLLWTRYFETTSSAVDLWGTILITIPLLMMWKFGRGLRKYVQEESPKG